MHVNNYKFLLDFCEENEKNCHVTYSKNSRIVVTTRRGRNLPEYQSHDRLHFPSEDLYKKMRAPVWLHFGTKMATEKWCEIFFTRKKGKFETIYSNFGF